MKKKFKETLVGKILNPVLSIGGSVLMGASGGALKPIYGAIKGLKEGVQQEILDNKESTTGGEDNIDWIRVVSMGITLVLAILLITGVIDMETFKGLVEAFGE